MCESILDVLSLPEGEVKLSLMVVKGLLISVTFCMGVLLLSVISLIVLSLALSSKLSGPPENLIYKSVPQITINPIPKEMSKVVLLVIVFPQNKRACVIIYCCFV
jgi:hypothetical protein